MATKRASKQISYGLIRQNPTSAVAGAFVAAGGTTNQWTNPGVANTNYRTVYYTAGVPVPDPGVTVDEYNVTSQLGLNKELTNFFVDSRSGLAKLNFAGPVDRNTIAAHLVAALQDSADENTTPYQKTITSAFKAGTVDFAGGDGFLHTLAIKQGASADDGTILENAIIDTLNLTFDFNAKGVARLVQMDGTWVGNEMNFEQTLSGTWVETTLTPFNNTDSFSFTTFTVDSVDWSAFCIRRMVLSINNNVTSNCSTAAGKANQYDVNPEITWTVILDHTDVSEKLMGDFQSGATVDINLVGSVASGTVGHLNIDTPFCKISGNPYAYNGDFLGYAIPLRAYQSSTTSPITVIVADALQWAYDEP